MFKKKAATILVNRKILPSTFIREKGSEWCEIQILLKSGFYQGPVPVPPTLQKAPSGGRPPNLHEPARGIPPCIQYPVVGVGPLG